MNAGNTPWFWGFQVWKLTRLFAHVSLRNGGPVPRSFWFISWTDFMENRFNMLESRKNWEEKIASYSINLCWVCLMQTWGRVAPGIPWHNNCWCLSINGGCKYRRIASLTGTIRIKHLIWGYITVYHHLTIGQIHLSSLLPIRFQRFWVEVSLGEALNHWIYALTPEDLGFIF